MDNTEFVGPVPYDLRRAYKRYVILDSFDFDPRALPLYTFRTGSRLITKNRPVNAFPWPPPIKLSHRKEKPVDVFPERM